MAEKRTLILGYGNADREDDGAAWHVLLRTARRLGRTAPEQPEEGFDLEGQNPELFFSLQLTPEMAEMLAEFERVCFVDAHTGAVPTPLHIQVVESEFQNSPFTHHLTPQSCLSICQHLYGSAPEAVLVSVRGYEFGFGRNLSESTSRLVDQAVEEIVNWLDDPEQNPAAG
jgi:hydrogenase maturation protease